MLFRHRLSLLAAGLCTVAAPAFAAEPDPAGADATVSLPAVVTPDASPPTPMVRATVAALATGARHGAFAVDPAGHASSDSLEALGRLRVGFALDTAERLGALGIQAQLAAEVASGAWTGQPELEGDRLPHTTYEAWLPTEAWLAAGWGELGQVRAGLMGSQWGLGLLANDGRPEQTGETWFTVPEVGDRVLRGALVLTPWRGNKSSPLRGLVVSFGADQVVDDDVLLPGDEARQIIGAARLFLAKDRWVGLYYAGRDQQHTSGRGLNVHALDAAADFLLEQTWGKLRLQGEAALILGETSLAPSPDHPEHDVRQMAALGRASAEWHNGLKAQLDAGWFSGDASLDDGTVSAFRADPNLQLGMLLFPRVLAYQSGRARLHASDPDLVGQPNDDLERLATGGSATSAIVLYPKAGVGLGQHLEVYGGALFALAPTPLADPRTSRTEGGGESFNFLGQAPDGIVLGTELGLGLRARLPVAALDGQLLAAAEGALLLPGGALAGLDEPVPGGRFTLAWLPAPPKP